MRGEISLLTAILCSGLIFAIESTAQDHVVRSTDSVQDHILAATLIVGQDKTLPQTLLPNLIPIVTGGEPPRPAGPTAAAPTKAFDQLYYLGMNTVGSWALVTSAGIIQFDSLDNTDEAQRIIEEGYKKLGLDPAQMKYLIITHGHGDHYGGAKYLQEKYHPRVLMSGPDWDMVAQIPPSNNSHFGAPPTRDMDVTDGEKLTLGNTTVTLYLTPGHTPATVSAIIPVTDHGQPHLLSFWGGTGFPQNMEPSSKNGGLRQYKRSLERFIKIGEAAKVDGVISNHADLDGSFDKAEEVQNQKPGYPNPWIIGQSGYIREMMVIWEMTEAAISKVQQKESGK